MLARNATIFKWTVYALAAAACVLLQISLLQHFTVWGVIPFLYPLLAAIPASYEGPISGTVFALAVGVTSDLLLPAPLPCFYTLVFPLAGLCAALISQSLLPAGYLCSVVTGSIAFALTGSLHFLLLVIKGEWATVAGVILLRELCVSLPLALPATYLFRGVFRRTHIDD